MLGIAEEIFKPVKTFSGGMKRKLEIIRSLMHDPKILFLDEPTQGLDAVSRASLWDYLQKVHREKKTTIFLTTHYIEEAEGADRICIVNHGKMLFSGSPEAMKSLMVGNYLLLDAEDRDSLRSELAVFWTRTNGRRPSQGPLQREHAAEHPVSDQDPAIFHASSRAHA